MLRLLIVIAVLGGVGAYLWGVKDKDEKPEVMYHKQVQKAGELEQKLQDDLKSRMEETDRNSE